MPLLSAGSAALKFGMLYDTLCVVDLDQRLKGTETQIGAWSGDRFWVATPRYRDGGADLGTVPGPHRESDLKDELSEAITLQHLHAYVGPSPRQQCPPATADAASFASVTVRAVRPAG